MILPTVFEEDLVQLRNSDRIGIIIRTGFDTDSEASDSDGSDASTDIESDDESEWEDEGPEASSLIRNLDAGKVLVQWEFRGESGEHNQEDLVVLDRAFLLDDAVAHPDGSQSGIVTELSMLIDVFSPHDPSVKYANIDVRDVYSPFLIEEGDVLVYKNRLGFVMSAEMRFVVLKKSTTRNSEQRVVLDETDFQEQFRTFGSADSFLVPATRLIGAGVSHNHMTTLENVFVEVEVAWDSCMATQDEISESLALKYDPMDMKLVNSFACYQLIRGDKVLLSGSPIHWVIDRTHTRMTIQWQDGTVDKMVPTKDYQAVLQLDSNEMWPGDVVSQSFGDSAIRFGILQNVDNAAMTAKVLWSGNMSIETVLLYNITREEDLIPELGDTVLIKGSRDKCRYVGCVANRNLDGTIEVMFPDGQKQSIARSGLIWVADEHAQGLELPVTETVEAPRAKVDPTPLPDVEEPRKQFFLNESPPCNHHYLTQESFACVTKKLMKRLKREYSVLESVAPNVYIETYSARPDLFRVLIFGSDGTVYDGICLQFDIKLEDDYPNSPPRVHYHPWFGSQSSKDVKLHPNLNADGSVCMSLLGTYRTTKGYSDLESWSGEFEKANLHRVVLSLVMLIGADRPWFSEDGWWRHTELSARDTKNTVPADAERRARKFEELAQQLKMLHTDFLLNGHCQIGSSTNSRSEWVSDLVGDSMTPVVLNYYKKNLKRLLEHSQTLTDRLKRLLNLQ